MNSSLYISFGELTYACVEGLRTKKVEKVASKPIVRPGDYIKTCHIQASYSGSRKVVSSSKLLPGHMGEAFTGKKQLGRSKEKLEFVRTLLIDNYDSYTYNIYQELSIINGFPPVVVRNDECTWEEICHYLYKERAFDNIVISPGPGSPKNPSDIGICIRLLLDCWDIPILGVCLGHQALGYVHGAQVVHAIEPVHGRLSEIEHNRCQLFYNIPSGKESGFQVVRYHSLVIDVKTLPKELIPIAWTCSSEKLPFLVPHKFELTSEWELEKGNQSHVFLDTDSTKTRKELMGIMHATRPHYGVQFHPESVATHHGRQIFMNFREITEKYWKKTKPPFVSQNIHYNAPMQVPHVSQHLNGIPTSNQSMNGADFQLHKEASASKQLMYNVDDNDCCSVDVVKFTKSSTASKFLKLKWRKYDSLASEVGGAKSIFCRLFGGEAENTFWLDSSSTEKGRARFSFMGGRGGSLWKQVMFTLADQSYVDSKQGGHLLVVDANGSTWSEFLKEGFFDFLNKELLSLCYNEKDYKGLPFEFYGGFVGYIGYNLKVECGAVSNCHKSKTPDACFFFADNLVVIDHEFNDVYLLSISERSSTESRWLDETEKKLVNFKASSIRMRDEPRLQVNSVSPGKTGFRLEKYKEHYIGDVRNCLNYIKDGESYELCLTTQMRKDIGKIDSLGLYLHLREKNPAPYAAWLNFSDANLCVCCSSPERFLRLDRNSVLEAKPIKGTIARGASLEEDEQFKLQLQYSEKDQAENLMIVDLLRNDLGRVCEPGSVHVPRLMDVESYATVHTMVSTVRGRKRSNISAVDCVRAAFPGGSMTGAPKLRSMEILDSIESCARGIYSGSIGFFSYNQTFDLNIVIRTVVIHEGEASIGAGGAIVALSNPEDEYEEMLLKTRAPADAVSEFEESQ